MFKIVFTDKNDKNIIDIVTIDDNKDISFKKDRVIIYGEGYHYSEFRYEDYYITIHTINSFLKVLNIENRIIDMFFKKFEYIPSEDEDNSYNKDLGILGEV